MTQLWRSFGDLTPLIVAIAIATLITAAVVARLDDQRRRTVTGAMLAFWLVGICAVTLFPKPGPGADPGAGGRSADLVPFRSIAQMLTSAVDWEVPLVQIGGNLALFVPLGFLLPLFSATARRSIGRTAWTGFAIAAGIELVQWLLGIGRVASIDDVLIATAGAALGWIISRAFHRITRTNRSAIDEPVQTPR